VREIAELESFGGLGNLFDVSERTQNVSIESRVWSDSSEGTEDGVVRRKPDEKILCLC
jgi:hypothetical protein